MRLASGGARRIGREIEQRLVMEHEAAGLTCGRSFAGQHIGRAHADQFDNLARRPEITAVFAGSDAILVGVLRVLASRSITVGGYVSVVTFDDVSPLELLATPVTAIRQRVDEMGEAALALMLAAIEGGVAPRTERLPVELVVRRSVRFLG